jgi:hypothetical protein
MYSMLCVLVLVALRCTCSHLTPTPHAPFAAADLLCPAVLTFRWASFAGQKKDFPGLNSALQARRAFELPKSTCIQNFVLGVLRLGSHIDKLI